MLKDELFVWQLIHFQMNGFMESSDKYKLHSQFISATFPNGLMARKMHATIPHISTAVLNNLPISIMGMVYGWWKKYGAFKVEANPLHNKLCITIKTWIQWF